MSAQTHAVSSHAGHDDHDEPHVLPLSVYFGVFGCLMVLTAVTIGVSRFDFGSMNTVVALVVCGPLAFRLGEYVIGGRSVPVTVTGSKTGYTGASFTSDSTSYVAAGTLTGATPKISGTVKVGKKLTAKPGAWTPSDTALSYQWYRGSSPIKGATKSTYKLVKADKKKQISVKVTGTKAGYTTLTTTSAKTKKVK